MIDPDQAPARGVTKRDPWKRKGTTGVAWTSQGGVPIEYRTVSRYQPVCTRCGCDFGRRQDTEAAAREVAGAAGGLCPRCAS